MRRILIISLYFLCSAVVTFAAERYYNVPFYDKWSHVPSDKLIKIAEDYTKQPTMRDSALVCYTVLANRYLEGKHTKDDIKYAIKAMTSLGGMYMSFYYDYHKSYEYLLQAQQLAEDNPGLAGSARIYLALANVIVMNESDGGDVSSSTVEMLKRAFYVGIDENDSRSITLALSNLVSTQLNHNDIPGFDDEVDRFRDMNLDIDPEHKKSIILKCEAAQACSRHDYATAGDLLLQASKCSWDDVLISRNKLSSMLDAGKMYRRARLFDKAESVFDQALMLAKQNDSKDFIKTVYGELSNLYHDMGDTAQEEHFELIYWRCRDSLMNQSHLADAKDVKFWHDLNRVNNEVERLNERQRLHVMLLFITLLVVAIITYLLYRLWKSYKRVQQSHYQLYLKNEALLSQENENQRQIETLRIKNSELETAVQQTQGSNETRHGKTKYLSSQMNESDAQEIFERIQEIMAHTDKIFEQGFTLNDLAELMGLRLHYVSQAINEIYGNNFNTLLNQFRIKEACLRLTDHENYGNVTIEAIGNSVGFKSRANFSVLFKQSTGLSPSEYRKMARKHN